MPVVEKIEETNLVQIFFLECQVYKHQGTIGSHNEIIVWEQGENKMEAIFKAVVSYIKYLNNQKL